MTEAELRALVADAEARFQAMSPEEQHAHMLAQRESWVRGQTGRDFNDNEKAQWRKLQADLTVSRLEVKRLRGALDDPPAHAIEAVARASCPDLWGKIDRYADDDDWNGATAGNAYRVSMKNGREIIRALPAALASSPPAPEGEGLGNGRLTPLKAADGREMVYRNPAPNAAAPTTSNHGGKVDAADLKSAARGRPGSSPGDCTICNGTGKGFDIWEKCPKCNGTGQEPNPPWRAPEAAGTDHAGSRWEPASTIAEMARLKEERAFWRRDAVARLRTYMGLCKAAEAGGDPDLADNFRVNYIRPTLAAFREADASEWHQRCEVCGEFITPEQPIISDDGGCFGHATCLSEDADPEQRWPSDEEDEEKVRAKAEMVAAHVDSPPAQHGEEDR